MPSSSRMAYTWAGDLPANRSLSSRASSAACPAAVSAAGCGARGPGGALSAAGTGLRWRCSVARDFPGNSHALFTKVSGSSSVTATSITWAASCLSPRSRRAVPRARALSHHLERCLSPCQFRGEFLVLPPQPLVLHRLGAASRPPGRLIRQAIRRAGLACFPLAVDMRGVKPFPAQQRAALAPGFQLVVLAQDPRLVRRGEGPPLRPAGPRALPGGHGTIMPRSGRRHVGHRHGHV